MVFKEPQANCSTGFGVKRLCVGYVPCVLVFVYCVVCGVRGHPDTYAKWVCVGHPLLCR